MIQEDVRPHDAGSEKRSAPPSQNDNKKKISRTNESFSVWQTVLTCGTFPNPEVRTRDETRETFNCFVNFLPYFDTFFLVFDDFGIHSPCGSCLVGLLRNSSDQVIKDWIPQNPLSCETEFFPIREALDGTLHHLHD